MTQYEWFRWLTFSIMPVHLQTVRNDIKKLLLKDGRKQKRLSVLDVGGRKSPYTIGLKADITLLDVPQEGATRTELHLGFTDTIVSTLQKKRSNIKSLVIQDMTKSTLQDASYDAVLCIEVIEHVEEDNVFVENISKVIKKKGWAYFTTPNGDFIKNEGPGKNPDHVRHYTKTQLKNLLEKHFGNVEVHYAVKTGKYRVWGLKSYKNGPKAIIQSVVGNVVNGFQSKDVGHSAIKTAHLVAIAYK